MRRLLLLQAEVGEEEVLGARAPGLKPGYNAQYEVMVDYGFIWDSSVSVPPQSRPVWPYTLDYAISHKCKVVWSTLIGRGMSRLGSHWSRAS